MIERQTRQLLRRGGRNFAMHHPLGDGINIHPPDLVSAHIAETSGGSQCLSFGVAPRSQDFATNAVLESTFMLDHQHVRSMLRHALGERRPAEAPSRNCYIV